jgi:hypothetical protein
MESILATTPFPPEDPIGVIIHSKGGSILTCVYKGELANLLSSLIQSRGISLAFTPPRCRSQLFSALNVAYDSMQSHGALRRQTKNAREYLRQSCYSDIQTKNKVHCIQQNVGRGWVSQQAKNLVTFYLTMFCYSQVSIDIGAKGKITSEGEVEVFQFRSFSLGTSHIELNFTHGNDLLGKKIGLLCRGSLGNRVAMKAELGDIRRHWQLERVEPYELPRLRYEGITPYFQLLTLS